MERLSHVPLLVTVTFILILVLPLGLEAQSTLNFPRLCTPEELSSTGLAIVNPGTATASLSIRLYGVSGTAISTSTQTLSPGGQLASLFSELFPKVNVPGWVQVTSETSGLIGFWLGGDFTTYTDGGEAALSSSDIIFPLVTGPTEINIANLGSAGTTVTLRLKGADGGDLVPRLTQLIPPRGIYQRKVADLFPTADLARAFNIQATADSRSGQSTIAGVSVIRGFLVPQESAVLNAVDAYSQLTTLNFPHAISGAIGSADYVTSIGITNLSSSPQTVTLTFTPEPNGQPIVVKQNIAANGAFRDLAKNIFRLPSGFQNGWIKVTSSAPTAGFMMYADTVIGSLTAVPVQATPRSTLFFAHIAGLPRWYTGIALLNASSTNANIEVSAMTANGTPIGSKTFSLNAGHKEAKVLSELIPDLASTNGGFVIVRSTNDVPIFGMELFGSTDGTILANVGGGALPIVYDGTWAGQFTVTAVPIRFTIVNNRITGLTMSLVILDRNVGCVTTVAFTSGAVLGTISNDTFNFTLNGDGLSTTIAGLFTSPNQMIGTVGQVTYTNYPCGPVTFNGSTPAATFFTAR